MKQYVQLSPEPGLFSDLTEYSTKNRWFKGHNFRFVHGQPWRINGHSEYPVFTDSAGTTRFIPGRNGDRGNSPKEIAAFSYLNPSSPREVLTHVVVCRSNAIYSILDGTRADNTEFKQATTVLTSTANREWSIDNALDNIILAPRNGVPAVIEMGTNTKTDMHEFSGALEVPTESRTMVVSKANGHVIFGGTERISNTGTSPRSMTPFNPRLIRFSHPYTFNFSPTDTNRAGDLELPEAVIAMEQTANSRIMIGTENYLFAMDFVGGTQVYRLTAVSDNSGAISKRCMIPKDDEIFWLGKDGFYVYTGTVTEIPCPIRHTFYEDLDWDNRDLIFGYHEPRFKELVWYYPRAGATHSNEEDLQGIIFFNYETNTWGFGRSADGRSCVTKQRADLERPLLANHDNVFEHECESNCSYDAAYLESGPFEIEAGTESADITRFIPDFEGEATYKVQLRGRMYPGDERGTTVPSNSTFYEMTKGTDKQDFKLRARQVQLLLTLDDDNDARIGINRIEAQPGGKR